MALSIFEKTDPDAQKQKDAEAALRTRRRDRDALNEKLGIAEAAIANYRAKARQLAAEGGDDKSISAAEASKRSSEDRVATLIGAVADIDLAIAKLERTIEQIIDRRMRVATCATVAAMADEGAKVQAAFDVAAAALEAWAKSAGMIIPEANAVALFVADLRMQLKPANEMVAGALQGHSKGVLNGSAPASLPRPAPAAPKLAIVPAEPTMNVFITKNAKFVAADGAIITLGRNKRHDLPKHLAEEALSSNVALPIGDPRCRDLARMGSAFYPEQTSCEWLGPPGAEARPIMMRPGGPITHSQFEPHPDYIDRKPQTFVVPVTPAEPLEPMAMAIGQRNNLPEGSDET